MICLCASLKRIKFVNEIDMQIYFRKTLLDFINKNSGNSGKAGKLKSFPENNQDQNIRG